MILSTLKTAVINAFLEYEPLYLQDIDPDALYSNGFKGDLIRQIREKIDELKADYPAGLYAKPATCYYCFPETPAVSFYAKATDEFVLRYMIAWDEKDREYVVRVCYNMKIEKTDDEFPF